MNHRHPQLEQGSIQATFRQVPIAEPTKVEPTKPAKFSSWVTPRHSQMFLVTVLELRENASDAVRHEAASKLGTEPFNFSLPRLV